ncbi:uncharacterized protein LOC117136226 isoform X3 [Drosophila mauritiana]|uniref:Uncharacterized protein LOC117136226 isoform X3 n=1 Tax=Drosophila mauritiana TaxID=7226 RepID=A0A6P8JAL2_DROMA|nr:uncharacterized protein LOC117136226 isoform X3 [Drosophila mauritiana]
MSSNENCQGSRRISENRHWNNKWRSCKAIPRLKSFFYFFDLEKGCRIIAGFEALGRNYQKKVAISYKSSLLHGTRIGYCSQFAAAANWKQMGLPLSLDLYNSIHNSHIEYK